jgi:hypothetical protein
MTATQQFIEDAIKGGWLFPPEITSDTQWLLSGEAMDSKALMLLDPFAWQAVYGDEYVEFERSEDNDELSEVWAMVKWKAQMHRFIDHLADGKTIEEALTQIT